MSEPLTNPFEDHLQPFGSFTPADGLGRWPLSLVDAVAPLPCEAGQVCGAFSLDLSPLDLIALSAPAVAFQVPPSSSLSLLYLTAGELRLSGDHQCWRVSAGGALVMPGARLEGRISRVCLVALQLPLDGILALCESLRIEAPPHSNDVLTLQQPRCYLPGQDPIDDALLASLDRLLQLLAQVHALGPGVLHQLGVGAVLTRLMLLLAFPELRQGTFSDQSWLEPAPPRDAFDQLIAYIKANLDQPLNLTVLEKQSHYSRRALQYAFKQRLGCTATQWIRAQRLDLAQRLLRGPALGDTVASIAQACGYRSMGLFSIEFQQRFHIKPSQLLREARSDGPS